MPPAGRPSAVITRPDTFPEGRRTIWVSTQASLAVSATGLDIQGFRPRPASTDSGYSPGGTFVNWNWPHWSLVAVTRPAGRFDREPDRRDRLERLEHADPIDVVPRDAAVDAAGHRRQLGIGLAGRELATVAARVNRHPAVPQGRVDDVPLARVQPDAAIGARVGPDVGRRLGDALQGADDPQAHVELAAGRLGGQHVADEHDRRTGKGLAWRLGAGAAAGRGWTDTGGEESGRQHEREKAW